MNSKGKEKCYSSFSHTHTSSTSLYTRFGTCMHGKFELVTNVSHTFGWGVHKMFTHFPNDTRYWKYRSAIFERDTNLWSSKIATLEFYPCYICSDRIDSYYWVWQVHFVEFYIKFEDLFAKDSFLIINQLNFTMFKYWR